LFKDIVQSQRRERGDNDAITLTSMANRACIYSNQGQWEEAEELEVQVLKISTRVLGPEHPSTLTSMANLACTYSEQGRLEEAEELELQVQRPASRF
jgi:tetratricopeptide (TPR) repeat protein